MSTLFGRLWRAPIGELFMVTDASGRLKVLIMNNPKRLEAIEKRYAKSQLSWEMDADSASHVVAQLTQYFAGERKVFDLEVAPEGTVFQRDIWQRLLQIPFGEVKSYGQLAREIGNPNASRGVGSANGANPICIVVPCHRIVGSNGTLTGFAYGVNIKADLLRLEGHRIREGRMPRLDSSNKRDQMTLF